LQMGMQAEFQQGHPAALAKRFESAAIVLRDEVGVEPSNESRELRNQLLTKLAVVAPATGAKLSHLHEEAERVANMGAWECDLVSGQLYWSPGTYLLFGIPVGSSIERDAILRQYDSASRERLEHVRAEAIRNRSGFSLEVDILSLDSIKKRLRIIAGVEAKNGIPLRIFGTKQLVG